MLKLSYTWFVVVVVAQNIKVWRALCAPAHSLLGSIQPQHSYTLQMFAALQLAQYRLDGHEQESFLSSVEYYNTTHRLDLLCALHYSPCSLSDFPTWSSNNMLLLSYSQNKWTAGLLPQWRKLLVLFWWSYLGQRWGHICLCQTEDNIWIE